MTRIAFLTAAASAAVLSLAAPTQAAILYSTGFEAPAFTTGPIAGQAGWGVYSADSEPGAVTVENSFVFDGAQAVETTGVSSQTGGYYGYGPITPTVPITVSAEIYVTDGSWQFAVLGPGLVRYAGGVNFVAGGDITPISAGASATGTFSADTWHDLSLTLNYQAQTYGVSLDGSVLASDVAFCGGNASCTGDDVPKFGDVFFDAFNSGGGAGYIDDVTVSSAPEPFAWTLMLVGTGMLGAALRQGRRNRAVA